MQLPQVKLLGRSRAMEQLREMIERVARSQAPVHIYGESGTGKELVAHLIHDAGARRDGPFVPVNCGAIPTELMESELFGHKKGSFTGAIADKQGLIQSAEGGTLFLDEIADLPLHMQVKLLRVIQEKSVRPVGESQGNADRRAHPVRDSQESRGAGRRGQVPRGPVLPRQRHRDPRAAAARAPRGHRRAGRSIIDAARPADRQSFAAGDRCRTRRRCATITSRATCASWRTCWSAPQRCAPAASSTRATCSCGPKVANTEVPIPERVAPGEKLGDALEDIERDAIVRALEQTRYNKTKAAQLLGMTFRSLRYRIKKLGIE